MLILWPMRQTVSSLIDMIFFVESDFTNFITFFADFRALDTVMQPAAAAFIGDGSR